MYDIDIDNWPKIILFQIPGKALCFSRVHDWPNHRTDKLLKTKIDKLWYAAFVCLYKQLRNAKQTSTFRPHV